MSGFPRTPDKGGRGKLQPQRPRGKQSWLPFTIEPEGGRRSPIPGRESHKARRVASSFNGEREKQRWLPLSESHIQRTPPTSEPHKFLALPCREKPEDSQVVTSGKAFELWGAVGGGLPMVVGGGQYLHSSLPFPLTGNSSINYTK